MLFVLFVAFLGIALAEDILGNNLLKDLKVFQDFVSFKSTYNKKYTGNAEEITRFSCFATNMQTVTELNSKGDQATYGVTPFSDLCNNEFKDRYANLQPEKNSSNLPTLPVKLSPIDAPDSFDWRKKGGVNPIRNQGSCGSCYAFSTVCAFEGAWFVGGNKLTKFSEEEIIECMDTTIYGKEGCRGRTLSSAISWVLINGLTTRENYPYTAGATGATQFCNIAKASQVVGRFRYLSRPGADESVYTTYVNIFGPLALTVNSKDWQHYTGGIRTACNGQYVDHGVNLVGYGVEYGVKYWIIRNTWDTTWGEGGYMRLARGVNCDALTTTVIAVKV